MVRQPTGLPADDVVQMRADAVVTVHLGPIFSALPQFNWLISPVRAMGGLYAANTGRINPRGVPSLAIVSDAGY
jgi:hypothetical protein